MLYRTPLVELNVAVTEVLPFITTLQVLDFPEHAPDQPANVEFAPTEAVRVTCAPALYVIPGGLLIAVPLPVPFFETVNVQVTAVKLALIV